MWKKILVILLFIICIGLGGYGTYYFYSQNQNQIAMNAQLTQQNSSIQQQLNAIGQMGVAYEVNTKVLSGRPIEQSDLVQVSIPVSAMGESSVSDINQLIGNYYKVNITPGTIITTDMLMTKDEAISKKKYTRELDFNSLPMGLMIGDYVDIRLALPNGEEYPVVTHLAVDYINEATISFRVTEEENLLINSMIQDAANYPKSCVFYLTRYIEPGVDTNTVAFYPVQNDIEDFVIGNPNISDTTRVLNRNVREHIDEILLVYTTNFNEAMSESFVSGFNTHLESAHEMRQQWIDANTDEDGNLTVEVYDAAGSAEAGTPGVSLDQATGEAMDSLEENIGQIEEIGGIY